MNRLIHARLLLAILIASGVGALEVGNLLFPASPLHKVVEGGAIAPEAITLPTIIVHAPAAIPTLPLVIVRPTLDQRQATPAVEAVVSSPELPPKAGSTYSTMPHVRLDMPYYSFGKMLPNVIKD